ncbi:Glutamate-rich WD repeat-containing protein 1 [Dermatophagoides pteronyssinus]|uniref:Glutamate-rich WD repeat-containing protein 1 n=1 Tax=Dermatophagoides pteronyssinus TaxID=6956 RepID=A0ABQ8JJY7_DERPT|nr:Glutamate-rich WD repeat-containing protein 1 [Dermatophagoides pteronyssinus]
MTILSNIDNHNEDDDDERQELNSEENIDIAANNNNDNDDDDNDNADEESCSSDSDYLDDEEDDDDYDDDENNNNDDDDDDQSTNSTSKRIYVPNMTKLSSTDNVEQLECDYSAYVLYHKAETGFPCLSFDVIEDQFGSGEQRAQTFPMTTYLVAGTQADKDHHNQEDEEEETLPDLSCTSIPHSGCVNRIRCRQIGDKLIVANWSDHGAVHLWDMSDALKACDDDSQRIADFNKRNIHTKPIYSFNGHHSPGFGLDWSPVDDGKLATGDSKKHIFIWNVSNDGWKVDQLPLIGHESSVEDIQWSPNESTILSSCSVDRTIRIWDTRNPRHQSAITITDAHQSDVNVLSWNRVEKAFILSGGDDGAIKVWDLRQVRRHSSIKASNGASSTSTTTANGGCKPVATFKQHNGPITSVDWHRTDGTVFAAAGEDHQITQWDLSVEPDEQQQQQQDDEKILANKRPKIDTSITGNDISSSSGNNKQPKEMDDDGIIGKLPPQLLFIHQGQKEVKEIHWHPQIPGLLISTAATGFDIFRTVSV